MGRAYTAKPAVVPEIYYPPGWNGDWPYPGIFPPGFDTPDLPEYDDLPPEEDDQYGNPIPRILVFPTSGLIVHESDDSVATNDDGTYFFVKLTARPTQGRISVPVTSVDTSEVITEGQPAGVTVWFDDEDGWDIPVKVKLAGVLDDTEDGNVGCVIEVGPSESEAEDYTNLTGHDVSVTNKETEYQLIVGVTYSTKTSASSGIPYASGFAIGTGSITVHSPKGTAKFEREENRTLSAGGITSKVITTTITGAPETFDTFSQNIVVATTGKSGELFTIDYSVKGAAAVFPSGTASALSKIDVDAKLYVDGELVDSSSDTISIETSTLYANKTGQIVLTTS